MGSHSMDKRNDVHVRVKVRYAHFHEIFVLGKQLVFVPAEAPAERIAQVVKVDIA